MKIEITMKIEIFFPVILEAFSRQGPKCAISLAAKLYTSQYNESAVFQGQKRQSCYLLSF